MARFNKKKYMEYLNEVDEYGYATDKQVYYAVGLQKQLLDKEESLPEYKLRNMSLPQMTKYLSHLIQAKEERDMFQHALKFA